MQSVARGQIWIFKPKKELAPEPEVHTSPLECGHLLTLLVKASDLDMALPQYTWKTGPASLERTRAGNIALLVYC